MILNAITLELATLLRATSTGLTIYPLTTVNEEEENYRTLAHAYRYGSERFIEYSAIPPGVSPINHFIDNAKSQKLTYILIKKPRCHARAICLYIVHDLNAKIELNYFRAYGWAHIPGCHKSRYNFSPIPNSKESKEEGNHLLWLKPIFKARKRKRSWRLVIDSVNLNTNDLTPIAKNMMATINYSYDLTGLHGQSEVGISGMAITDTGRMFDIDYFISMY